MWMIKKKKCYRVQVGPWKYGLLSKCMPKKDAEKISHWIDNGWLRAWVLSGSEATERRKRFG
ncbi:unnamed protein product [marine sediment metagenome]|uniref:Uncharacterized protein n=1 Tax=marine sediment metagenome TaxID=412755 RepID=X0UMY7_9ZZZZ